LLVAGVGERVLHRVEEDAVLRIGDLHPQRGHVVVQRRELVDIAQEPDLARVRLVGLARARVVVQAVIPAILGDRGEADAGPADVPPVGVDVVGLGESTGQSNDCDVFGSHLRLSTRRAESSSRSLSWPAGGRGGGGPAPFPPRNPTPRGKTCRLVPPRAPPPCWGSSSGTAPSPP